MPAVPPPTPVPAPAGGRPTRDPRRLAGGLLPCLLLAACGTSAALDPGLISTPPPPAPSTLPVPEPIPVSAAPDDSLSLEAPIALPDLDPILDSPWALDREMEERVEFWVNSLRTREREHLSAALGRMGAYRGAVEEEIRRQGLPASLVYLPIVESWYAPTAASGAGAVGLWQFMAPTARGMGLQVNRLLDERRDPFRSTPMALKYLAELEGRFGSWFLALAAYNGGPGRMDRILRGRTSGEDAHDGLFMEVLRELPRETRDFVPRFLAVGRIARDPAAHGFGEVAPLPPLGFDDVAVPDAASLDVVARAAGVDLREVEALNPQLLRGLTPAGVATSIRLPPGRGGIFREAFALIPPEERVTFVEHAVVRGETLTHIGRRYGVALEDLRAANPSVDPRRMQIGQRIVVPVSPSAQTRIRAEGAALADRPVLVYRVRAGDTLSAIAARHRVKVGDLLRWNGLSMDSVIRPGDEVRIHSSSR